MNTPAHLLLGAACFARPDHRKTLAGAMLGALMPDLSLYLLAGGALLLFGLPEQVVFGELYYSDTWQTIFAIDNSVFVWVTILALALWRRAPAWQAFASAALLHLLLDFPLHAGDGRAHFWPLSNWVFDSPVSYWDSHHFAVWVAPVAIILCVLSFATLWRRYSNFGLRTLFAILLGAEIWVARQWILFF